jgi:hypothetical protein
MAEPLLCEEIRSKSAFQPDDAEKLIVDVLKRVVQPN